MTQTPIAAAAALLAALLAFGCAGEHAGPRTLAGFGAIAVGAGSGMWGAGERMDAGGSTSASRMLINGGVVAALCGVAAIVGAGGWMAASVACVADPDCPEDESCREVPAPPGGVPFRQCVPRRP